jgi:hypothetical protein
VFLGLGEEGHTASLFPGSPALGEQTRWVVAVDAPADPPLRLTLTLPALTRAANIYILAMRYQFKSTLRPSRRSTIDRTGLLQQRASAGVAVTIKSRCRRRTYVPHGQLRGSLAITITR